MRFSIRTLLGIIAIAAAGFSALLTSYEVWAKYFVSACLLVLLGSFVGIIYCRGQRRAFWIGFAIFGWGYFLAYWGRWAICGINWRPLSRSIIWGA